MKPRLSALMDDELERHETDTVFDALRRDGNLRRQWQEWRLIGDALNGEPKLDGDVAARVMDALRNEPVVLAPRAAKAGWRPALLALAATVAGVAAVAWVALGPQGGGETTVAEAARTLALREPAAEIQPVKLAGAEMQEYLVAHQAQSSFLQFRGGAEHIRTVSATRSVPVK